MPERFKEIKQEQLEGNKKYILPDKNIIALDENSEIRKKNEKFRSGLQTTGIDIPMEIQGSGLTNPETREFSVAYPKGDVFASWAVTIHELGHLRQAERLGYKKSDDIPNNIDTETDASEKGWESIKQYSPEILENLNNQFQKAKTEEKLKTFTDFVSFYNYIMEKGKLLADAQKKLPDNIDPLSEESGKFLAEEIYKSPELLDFFKHQERWKTGVIINQEEVEKYIRQTSGKIAEEVFDK